MTYMLDTNICIHIIRWKRESVLNRLRVELERGADLCISSVTLAELEYAVRHSSNPTRNATALIRFLAPFSVIPFDSDAVTEYGA